MLSMFIGRGKSREILKIHETWGEDCEQIPGGDKKIKGPSVKQTLTRKRVISSSERLEKGIEDERSHKAVLSFH